VIDIKIPPPPPRPEGAAPAPTPADDEVDAFFNRAGEEALSTQWPSMVKALFDGLDAFLQGNLALLTLLVNVGVLLPEQAERFPEIRHALSEQAGKRTMKDFVHMAAHGLVRVNGSPLTPDEISCFITAVLDEPSAERVGAALRMVVSRAYPPDRFAALFQAVKGAASPFKALVVHEKNELEETTNQRLRRLETEVAELRKLVRA